MGGIAAALMPGVLVGSLSGLVGIGGGMLLVPLLLYVFKADMHIAAGTSLAIIIPTAVAGSLIHFSKGNVDWRLAALIAGGGIVGSILGAWAGATLPTEVLKKAFALVLVSVSVKVALDAFSLGLPGATPGQAGSPPDNVVVAGGDSGR